MENNVKFYKSKYTHVYKENFNYSYTHIHVEKFCEVS